jgi:hypothetical protein
VYLPGSLVSIILNALSSIQNTYYKIAVLSKLVPHLTKMNKAELYSFWRKILHHYSTCHRSDLLKVIRTLAPIIHEIGGQKAVLKTILSIKDMGKWWS